MKASFSEGNNRHFSFLMVVDDKFPFLVDQYKITRALWSVFFNSWSPWQHVMLLSNKSDVNLGSWVIFSGRVRPKNVLLPKPPSWRENRSKNNPTCTKVDPKTLHRRWTLLVMYSWTKGGIDSGSGDCFVMYILAFSMYYMELLHDCLDYKKFTL